MLNDKYLLFFWSRFRILKTLCEPYIGNGVFHEHGRFYKLPPKFDDHAETSRLVEAFCILYEILKGESHQNVL